MRLPVKVLSFFFAFVFLFSFASPTHAQMQNNYNTFMRTDQSVPLTVSTFTQGVFFGMLSSATCAVGGVDYLSPNHRCLSYNDKTGTFAYASEPGGGILGLGVTAIAMTYNSPFHTSDYIKYLSQNFGVAKHAYAADGIGFNQLSPITSLWIAFRNLSYLLFVIAFVVVGFAIMLRAKIDPRTVMTIENQIPKLIVALILITFSFAIAGFMIDVMWVAIYLVINLFGGLDPEIGKQIGALTSSVKGNPFEVANSLNSGFGGFLGIAGQASSGVFNIANTLLDRVFQAAGFLKFILIAITGLPSLIVCAFTSVLHIDIGPVKLGTDFGACLDNAFAGFIAGVIAGIAFLIFAVALIVALARLWWSLIKAYSLFIIFSIFGPLMIMMGVLPGSKTNFEYWIRHIIAYLIVVPVSISMLLLGKTLMDVYGQNAQVVTAPPMMGIGSDPKITTFLGPLLGFAVIMLIPQALSLTQEALNAPDPKFLAGIGQSIGVGAQFYGAGVGKAWDRIFRASDPLHNLDEGIGRKILLPRTGPLKWVRRIVIGKETGLNVPANKLGKS